MSDIVKGYGIMLPKEINVKKFMEFILRHKDKLENFNFINPDSIKDVEENYNSKDFSYISETACIVTGLNSVAAYVSNILTTETGIRFSAYPDWTGVTMITAAIATAVIILSLHSEEDRGITPDSLEILIKKLKVHMKEKTW